MDKEQKDWARKLFKGIQEVTEQVCRDEKANPDYWNGDDWGSISGVRDAREWIEDQILEYLCKAVDKRIEYLKDALIPAERVLGRLHETVPEALSSQDHEVWQLCRTVLGLPTQ